VRFAKAGDCDVMLLEVTVERDRVLLQASTVPP
jgi:hypothetical protein